MKFKITSNVKGILGVNFKNQHQSLEQDKSFEVEATSLEIKELEKVYKDKITVENISFLNNPKTEVKKVSEVKEPLEILESETKEKKKQK